MSLPTREECCIACAGSGVVEVVLDKVCARCNEPFAMRSRKTAGVLYCSQRCANAASQAQYRQRKRESVRRQKLNQEEQ